MNKFLTAGSTTAVLAVAFLTLTGVPAPASEDAALEQRIDGLEKDISELRTEIEANHKAILKQLKVIASFQRTLVSRGVTMIPELAERVPKPGDQTEVRIGAGPALGTGAIEVVEYGEFQCPFCIRQAGLLKQLVEAHPGQVRASFKHYPLARHKAAVEAAKASWAAHQQGKFWEMYDALFSSRGKLDVDVIRGHAEAIGLDMAKFDADVSSKQAENAVFADRSSGRKAGVRGTPTYYVNGRLIGGRADEVEKALAREVATQKAKSGEATKPPA